ncbi:hypothetical protein MCANPG14_00808 [Mycoplasmopsis canis PG 14]|uniref:DUF2779 domain-containing protein n=1 Tax=Mycoplasmopsis canis TaxID=29555 RepID=A0A449AQB5_9BACT|nr:hypothetical protein [Mycoplasmopsis canis]AMD81352.1 hypothetical protein AXW82_02210 [Mycoplasmopsis canis PG 14]EIE40504.1 hypothetical protein MCANPG14_00808 [Mycoplasmopsis canis PG 14]VEU68670.1 Uncharacterised protein [Mycoplasmopsis canis]
MNKIKIYIDFEAITFNYLARINYMYFKKLDEEKIDLPYCYTIGYFKNQDKKKNFKTLSNIFDLTPLFKMKNINNFWIKAREILLSDIKQLINYNGENNILDNIEFYSWNNTLESPILEKLFNLKSNDLSNGINIGLDKLVPKSLFKSEYFEKTFKSKINELSPKVKFNNETSSGRIAACLGALLIINGNPFYFKKSKLSRHLSDEDIEIIISDVLSYNKDDVVKLSYIEKNKDKTNEVANLIKSFIYQKNKISNTSSRICNCINGIQKTIEISSLPSNIKISEFIEKLNYKIEETTLRKENDQAALKLNNFYTKVLSSIVSDKSIIKLLEYIDMEDTIDDLILILEKENFILESQKNKINLKIKQVASE